ncbi:MAG TPA: methyltransferase domain-containing protein, partial [Streptosporangiaceae bacterium]
MGTAYRGAQDADEYNVADAGSAARVDELNSRFYGEFPFPEPEDRFVRYEDPGFWQLMVNQELGYFGNGPLRSGMKIWVAGCGTNQGIQVALRFPDCQVYATDISPTSLRIAEQAARSLGIANIHFERRSI